ncbi:6-bladed beta-propeller [Phosphitispora sp. TUW77]|uniref:6-bladed beta-propeller n=1 Tax=Phosphitispora sp. TUW77 TaxID=3152361 RepID=UPI003AB216F1
MPVKEHIDQGVAGKSEEFGRSRIRSRKTITLKTLMLLIIFTIIIISALFGFLYYRGQKPVTSVLPVTNKKPEYRFSIYEGRYRLSHPIAVFVYNSTNIYISNNKNHTVEIVGPNGKPKGVIGGAGDLPGNLMFPYGLAVLPGGNILIAETGNYRIEEYSPEGKYIKTFLGPGNKAGIQKPGPVCIDDRGQIYVGDLSGNQVVKFDRDAKVLEKFPNISYPHGIAVDVARNKLYISDSGASVIKVYELDSSKAVVNNDELNEEPVRQPRQIIDSIVSGVNFSMVRGLAVDRNGRLYAVDTLTSMIRVFDTDGKYLFSFGKQGSGDGEFLYPAGIYVDDAGRIYIADWGNNRIQVWGY